MNLSERLGNLSAFLGEAALLNEPTSSIEDDDDVGVMHEAAAGAKQAAIDAYKKAREDGKQPPEAAQEAWNAVRRVERRLRAPSWAEALSTNTSARRSYRSPLGEVLGVSGAGDFGHHAANWPRTKRSLGEAESIAKKVIAVLEKSIKAMK